MKRFFLTTAILIFTASPALALKITNLDKVPHTLELTNAGTPQTITLAPDATELVTGISQGKLSLKTAPVVKKAKGTVQADGLLSGVIGNGRNQDIPVDMNDSYVIWPGGDLRLQSHRKDNGGSL